MRIIVYICIVIDLYAFISIHTDIMSVFEGEMVRDHVLIHPDLFSNTAKNSSEGQATPEYRKEMRDNTPENSMKTPVVEQIIQQETIVKKVSKIMVFYSDNTFETFISEKNKKE